MLFVVDASVGMTDDDEAIATWLRRSERPVLVVANKADNDRREAERWEFLALGLGEPIPVSALHGRRAGDLLDEVIARSPAVRPTSRTSADEDGEHRCELVTDRCDAATGRDRRAAERRQEHAVQPARRRGPVGRPRHAGHHRDAIDTLVETADGPIVFVDTAGMRRRRRRSTTRRSTTRWSARCAPIDEADIALLVIDATEGITGQDQRLAERVDAAGCPIVVLLNKWDLVDDAEAARSRSRRELGASSTSSATRRC